RWFAQGFIQAEIDVHGNPVTISGTGSGRIQNTDFLYLDAGVGYYAYQSCDPCARIRSIAPTVELHYNVALEDGNSVTSPGGITVGSTLGGQNVLDLLL